ncbi:MAG: hypothetical protein AB1632_03675 [Nitrospirota bacterium]
MKRLVAGLAIAALLTIGAAAYAHGPGWIGGGQYGPGCENCMGGPGYGGHMRGWSGTEEQKKFLEETADLRKELHNKRFEYSETLRNPNASTETITNLEKEIRELQDKIHEKAPRSYYGKSGGYGCRW